MKFCWRTHPLSLAIGLTIVAMHAADVQAGEISGEVRSTNGNARAGVVVQLRGTGYRATTNAQGVYRFSNLPGGRYTLVADTAQKSIEIPDSGEVRVDLDEDARVLGTVTVVARNRVEASALERAAVNTVNVLSQDDLQNTAVHNVAEALGLLPGVNVFSPGASYNAGIDGASRGEGRFASIRGLNAEYNVNMINGVTVAQGQPYSRGVELALLPPSGLQTIELNKTSTPDMDGDAIGGTLDYRTPSAFNFSKPLGGSVTMGARMESQARRYGDKGLGGALAGEFYARMGNERQFGLYLNLYGDTREFVNSQYAGATAARQDNGFRFARTDSTGRSLPGLDPEHNLVQTGMSVAASSGKTRRYGGSLALDWRIDHDTRAWMRGTYARADTEHESTLMQLFGQDVVYEPIAGGNGAFQPAIKRLPFRFWYQTNPEMASLSTFQLGFDRTGERWRISSSLFYSEGHNDRPYHIEISARTDQAGQPDAAAWAARYPVNQTSLTRPGSNDFPVLQVPDGVSQWLAKGVGDLHGRRWGDRSGEWSGQRKWGGRVDLAHHFDEGALEYVKFGFKHVQSTRDYRFRKFETGNVPSGTYLRDMGIVQGSYDSAYPGQYDWNMPRINRERLKAQINGRPMAERSWSCGTIQQNRDNCDAFSASETVTAAYVMAKFNVDTTEIIPGFRIEHTSIENRSWSMDRRRENGSWVTLPGYWQNTKSRFVEFLPSIHVNHRIDDQWVLRGALWTSYTRPPFVQLGGARQMSFGDDGKIRITEGNPQLKPIRALNFDAGVQWNNGQRGTQVSAAVFHKKLRDYIYEYGTDRPYDDIAAGQVFYSKPINAGNGSVRGMELAVRQKLSMLEGPMSGWSAGFNVTTQRTTVDLARPGYRSVRMQNAPDLMGNADLSYEYGGFSANLSYHYTGRYISVYDYLGTRAPGNWDDLWVKPNRRVDLHVGYRPHDRWRFDLSVSNLLKHRSYHSHIGRRSTLLSDIVDTGQTWLLTTRVDF